MQNNNDFRLGGACGAKSHGKRQLVKLNTYDTQHQGVQFLPAPPKQPLVFAVAFLHGGYSTCETHSRCANCFGDGNFVLYDYSVP